LTNLKVGSRLLLVVVEVVVLAPDVGEQPLVELRMALLSMEI
jgi:hypothetical protein